MTDSACASAALPAVSEEDYPTIAEFCRTYKHAYSTTSEFVRNGRIPIHQFMGDKVARVYAPQANEIMSKVKKRYTRPTMCIIQHDEKLKAFA
jgi:hypothetical protein